MSMSVKKMLFTLVSCAVMSILLLGLYGKWQMDRIYNSATQRVYSIEAIRDIRAHVSKQRLLLYRHVTVEDKTEKVSIAQEINAERAETIATLQHYARDVATERNRQMLDDENALLAWYWQRVSAVIEQSNVGNVDAALALLQQQSATEFKLGDMLDRHVQDEIAQGRGGLEKASGLFRQASLHSLLFILAVVAVVLSLGYTITKRITLQVDRMRMLARDNEMFREMVECVSGQAITVHDVDNGYRIIYANAAACHHFGVDLETLLTWTPDKFDPHATPEMLKELSEQWGFGPTLLESEHRIASGELIPVDISINTFKYFDRRLNICLTRDLRPRHAAEAQKLALQRLESEQDAMNRLSRFAQSVPGFMYTLEQMPDGHAVITYASPAVEEIYGVAVENVLANISNVFALISPQDIMRIQHQMEVSFRNQSLFHIEYRIQHPVKGERWMEARSMPDVMDDGSILWHGFVMDITERKLMEMDITARERELRTLVTNTPDVIIRYDRECRRTYVSQNYEQVYGNHVSAVLGKKPTEAWGLPRMSPAEYEARLRSVMETGEPNNIELDWLNAEDDYVCQSLRVVPERDDSGQIVSVLTITRDVSEIKRAARSLREREQEYRTLVHHSPEMVIRYDTQCRIIFVNSAFEQISGLTQEEALTRTLAESWVPENITCEEFIALLQEVMASGRPTNVILEWHGVDGQLISHDMRVVPEHDEQGQLKGVLVIGHNITRLRHAEIALRQRSQEFQALVEHSPDTITRYDRDCRRIYANPRMRADAGVPEDELLYKTPEEFPGGEQGGAYQDKINQAIISGQPSEFELTWRNGEGREVCSHIRMTPEFDSVGQVDSILAVGRDITEIDAYRKQIHNMAFFDSLTSLPNRALFSDRIQQTVADASWHGQQFGLILLDLDRFKEINDTLGHAVGDRVLRVAADRLLGCVRIYDTVARLGGDEFAILLPQVRDADALSTVANKILDAFGLPFILDGRELFISTSIGIALYPEDSVDVDALFRYADSAMYHAKNQGRNNFQFYSAELTARSTGRMNLEASLRKAMARNELELYYQPQVNLTTGRIIGAEALLRWNRDGNEMITPDRFIPVAEETGLIIGIGAWVLESACRTAVEFNRNRADPLQIAVNLSTRQFIFNDIVGTVKQIMHSTGCHADWIKLEITESLLLENNKTIADMLNAFDEMGLIISIDDFGTGYSALSYLNRFPVSQIKIDRSFVSDIPHDADKSELVKAMIYIARALRMDLVAEGVETREQADYLVSQGCPTAQGYLFGRPMQLKVLQDLLNAQDVAIALPILA